MTPGAVSDTHAAIWYLNADPRLSSRAKEFIDESGVQGKPVLISAITLVEVVYLQEKGKIPSGTLTRLEEALRAQDAVLRVADLTLTVALAVGRVLRDEVPDMPDRIIAATALHFGLPVISRDGKIKTSAVNTIW
jgi:PIN domain nuclease of toxin-antitoxin system